MDKLIFKLIILAISGLVITLCTGLIFFSGLSEFSLAQSFKYNGPPPQSSFVKEVCRKMQKSECKCIQIEQVRIVTGNIDDQISATCGDQINDNEDKRLRIEGTSDKSLGAMLGFKTKSKQEIKGFLASAGFSKKDSDYFYPCRSSGSFTIGWTPDAPERCRSIQYILDEKKYTKLGPETEFKKKAVSSQKQFESWQMNSGMDLAIDLLVGNPKHEIAQAARVHTRQYCSVVADGGGQWNIQIADSAYTPDPIKLPSDPTQAKDPRYIFDATQNVCKKALDTCQSTGKTCSIVNHGKWISTSQRPINLTLNCADRDKPYSRRGTGKQVPDLKQELEQEARGAKSCIFNIYSDGDVLISPDEQQRTLIHTDSTDDGFVIDGLAGEVEITQLGDPQKPANVVTLKARQRYQYRFPQPRNLTNDEKKQVYEEPVVQEFLKCNNWEEWNKEICDELNQYRQALNLQFYRPSAINVEAIRFDNGIEVLKATVDLTKSGVLVSLGNDEGRGISNSNFNRFLQKNNPVLAMGGVYKSGNWNLRSQGKTLGTGTQSLYTVLVLNSKNQPDMITLTDAGTQLQFEQYLFVLQAGPRLVRQGKATVTKSSTETEGHTNLAGIFENQSRRAGIGFSQDKTKLYYVTSTGNSRGLSLRELAEVMASEKIGCWDAMNLDGGDGPALAHDGFIKEPAGVQAQPYLILVHDN